ncbi:hypothetical protein EV424DRAFT_1319939, partial [Suillus variegatus]
SSSVSLARTIGTWVIVNTLFFADHALQLHHQAVENWRNWFGHLIKLEADIAAILHDEEIILTRLIKLSKSSKTTRDESTNLALSLLLFLRHMALLTG